MKIAILGAHGLIGSHLCREIFAQGVHSLRVINRGDNHAEFLDEFKPDWVVHAGGFNNVDRCEEDHERAMWDNFHQPVALQFLCENNNIKFCYLSSIYAFDAHKNIYASSKWACEQSILHTGALIPRLCWVWGEDPKQKCFPYQVRRAVEAKRPLPVAKGQIGQPTWAGDIAYWLVRLMQAGEHGIWNLAASEAMPKEMFASLADPRVEITVGQMKTPRMLDCRMDTTQIQQWFPRDCKSPSEFGKIIDASQVLLMPN